MDVVASANDGLVDVEPRQFHGSTGIMVPVGEDSQPYMVGTVLTESVYDWRGGGCRKFVPVLGEDDKELATPEDIFDQPPDEMS